MCVRMITRNKNFGCKKTQTAENKTPLVLVTRINPHRAVKAETTKSKKSELKKCYVKVVRLKTIAQNQSDCPNDDAKITLNQGKSKGILKKNLKKPKQCKENNRILQADRTTITPVKKLRTRRPVKYAESTLEISKSDEKQNGTKVPIYKQILNNERLPKHKEEDQYEFDSDSEKYKKGKRRKLDDESDSDSYNKTIQNILKNIAKRAKLRKKKIYDSEQKQPVKDKKVKKITVLKSQSSINNIQQLDNKSNEEMEVWRNLTKTNIPNVSSNNGKITYSEQNLGNAVCENYEEIEMGNMVAINDDDDESDDEFFEPTALDKTHSSKIKILDDIQLQPKGELNLSIASPRLFKDGKPDANSTVLNCKILTPWRYNNDNISRNPHFITIKQSALPCISQEMVLDHTLVDKLNETAKIEKENLRSKEASKQVKTRKNDDKKSLLQPTLNDYFDGTNDNKENENHTNLCLFDNDLSPIKTGNRFANKCEFVKRKILGERNENTIQSRNATAADNNSQEHIVRNGGNRNKNLTNFGFNSDDDDNVENEALEQKGGRPFRFYINPNDKKYQRKQKVGTRRIEPMVVSDDEESDASDAESENGEIGLFEDFCNTKNLIEIQEEKMGIKKKTRKHDDNKGLQKQKKRKDVRTKEEEEEAEKWAQNFNSMCEEIEQFPLEIE